MEGAFQRSTEQTGTRNPNISTDNINDLNIETSYITKEEITKAINNLKNNKAAGNDCITGEVLKADIEFTSRKLETLFRLIWDKEEIPKDWEEGLIVKLPKKGDLTKCGNWRGLTLMSIPAKILGRTIIMRLRDTVDRILREEQAGFRPKRGTIEQLFILRNIIEQSYEWNTNIYMIFVDFQKAFDSIHRETLWKIMKLYGIPEKIINIIKTLYQNTRVAVIHDKSKTDWFDIKSGVKQGCVMSGFLFLLVVDWIMRRTTEDRPRGLRWVDDTHLEDLDYADDIVLLSQSWNDAQEKMDRLANYAERTGLKINTDKTESMRINCSNPVLFTIWTDGIKEVDKFTYLGGLVTKWGGADEDMLSRIGKARYVYHNLKSVWNSSQYRRRTKIKIFETNVLSVLLYGCETWKMNRYNEKRIDIFVQKCLRRILKIYYPNMISNDELYKLAKVQKVTDTIKYRRRRYLGHILRQDPSKYQHAVIRWKPDGKRNIGRPRETWFRTVERDFRSMRINSWQDAHDEAQDRNSWRKLICGPTLPIRRNRI